MDAIFTLINENNIFIPFLPLFLFAFAFAVRVFVFGFHTLIVLKNITCSLYGFVYGVVDCTYIILRAIYRKLFKSTEAAAQKKASVTSLSSQTSITYPKKIWKAHAAHSFQFKH